MREIREEISNIEKRISIIKKSQQFAKEQLLKLESRLHQLEVWENCAEEYSAGLL